MSPWHHVPQSLRRATVAPDRRLVRSAGALVGLRPVGSTSFDSERTRLDHVSFAVASRGELKSAATALTEAGIKHGETTDLPDAGLTLLSF